MRYGPKPIIRTKFYEWGLLNNKENKNTYTKLIFIIICNAKNSETQNKKGAVTSNANRIRTPSKNFL